MVMKKANPAERIFIVICNKWQKFWNFCHKSCFVWRGLWIFRLCMYYGGYLWSEYVKLNIQVDFPNSWRYNKIRSAKEPKQTYTWTAWMELVWNQQYNSQWVGWSPSTDLVVLLPEKIITQSLLSKVNIWIPIICLTLDKY